MMRRHYVVLFLIQGVIGFTLPSLSASLVISPQGLTWQKTSLRTGKDTPGGPSGNLFGGEIAFEITPWTTTLFYDREQSLRIPSHPDRIVDYFFSYAYTRRCKRYGANHYFSNKPFVFDLKSDCEPVLGGDAFYEHLFRATESNRKFWRLAYQGIFTAHYLNHHSQETNQVGDISYLVTLNHGENKTLSGESIVCENGKSKIVFGRPFVVGSISKRKPAACFDGAHAVLCTKDNWDRDCKDYCGDGKAYRLEAGSCGDGYFGFVGLSLTPVKYDDNGPRENNLVDYGPMVWPANSYTADGNVDGAHDEAWQFLGHGVRHPSSLVHDGYLYVYYWDHSNGNESEGRAGGIKVARVRLAAVSFNDRRLPFDPYGFQTYFNSGWNKSLPNDSVAKLRDALHLKGGAAANILRDPDHSARENASEVANIIRFSVAKVRNRPEGDDLFLGVELHGKKGIRLRYSNNLVDWSAPIHTIPESEYKKKAPKDSWRMNPIFLNQSGTSHTEIDLERFYIATSTTGPNATVYLYPLSASIVP